MWHQPFILAWYTKNLVSRVLCEFYWTWKQYVFCFCIKLYNTCKPLFLLNPVLFTCMPFFILNISLVIPVRSMPLTIRRSGSRFSMNGWSWRGWPVKWPAVWTFWGWRLTVRRIEGWSMSWWTPPVVVQVSKQKTDRQTDWWMDRQVDR